MARRYSSEESKKRILSACVKLFIINGYHKTTIAQILEEAQVSSSTFQNIFRSKDGVLLDLTEFMFKMQFETAEELWRMGKSLPYIYAIETSIQMTLAELNENLRDVYVEAYSNAGTLEYIFEHTSTQLHNIFKDYLKDCTESDFYEIEIGTSGMMRNFMAKKCDKYFTLEKKLERFLSMSMKILGVGGEEICRIIEEVLSLDIRKVANNIMQDLFKALAMRFEFELSGTEREEGGIGSV